MDRDTCMGGRERRVSLPCDVGHPYSGMEVPEDKAWEQGVCRNLGAKRPPAYTGGWHSALLDTPASSVSRARSVLGPQWGLTTGCNLSQKNQLQAYLGFSAPSERIPSHLLFFPTCSGLPYFPHLLSLTCSFFLVRVLFHIPSQP